MVPTNRKQAVPRSRNRGTNYPRSASAHIVICDEGSGLVYRGSWSSGPAVGTASGSGTSYTATFNNVSQLLINGSEFTIVPDSTSSDYSQRDTGQFSTVWSAN
ncbi:Uncharacterised protein [Corynebacterium striatum]|uniref:Uncharacterized protein n=1 Tax=Corynebacterium striatum TaxID=43770 RepID=A0AAQ1Z6Z0_CORST|nr:hypothetical protein [Corynebacterium striatum]QQE53078.1 hypothetical protein I6I11_13670 [Corynebacterium striatum]GEA44263.1 hypothetical protein Cst04h_24330 [Corynebacterium striatum]STD61591.1 Uncharacterised protein [Corynebacterium striatum]